MKDAIAFNLYTTNNLTVNFEFTIDNIFRTIRQSTKLFHQENSSVFLNSIWTKTTA